MSLRARSIVLLFLTAIIWGFAFVAQRIGGDILGAFYFNGIRYALGALSLIPVILIFEKERKDPSNNKKSDTAPSGAAAGVPGGGSGCSPFQCAGCPG